MACKYKKNRAKPGEGSLRLKSNGRYEFRFTYEDEYGEVRHKSLSGDDPEECICKAEAFMEQAMKMQLSPYADYSITDLLKQKYDKDYEMNLVGEQGYARNIESLKIIDKYGLGKMPIQMITDRDIYKFLKNIKHYSNSVISKSYRQVNQALKAANEMGIVEYNIIKLKQIRCPKSDKPNKKVRGFTEQEQRMLLQALEEHTVPKGRNTYKNQLLIELYSGMRMGEINALSINDIDFENKVVHVRKTVSRGLDMRNFLKDGTKTINSQRDVPMSSELENVLRISIAESHKNPMELIFYDYKKGNCVTTSQVNNFFRRICEKAGLPFTGQHALRHTFATRCIESGVQPIVLKNWLGHKSIQMTIDTYSDVFDRMNMNAISMFDKHISVVNSAENEQ